jgi:D-alanyl-lipoteichoic acid acyltransferase DltB (MBOAT superfamily)
MLFNSAVFVVFLLVTLGSYWATASTTARHWLLIVASLVFYGWWDYRFVPLLLYVTLVAYGSAKVIELWPDQRKRWITLSIILQLGQLAFFKYTNFLFSSAHDLMATAGLSLEQSRFSIVLPVGVSFYTFHGISYVVDVYRGKLERAQSLRVVALYIVFFPQLVAGPIVRADSFIPQLFQKLTLQTRDIVVGMKFIVMGLVYKGIFADQLAPLLDPVFKTPEKFTNSSLALASFGFYSQIYFDFVGYSTMAIGLSRLFGFKLPRNFDFPYRAASITDFWRRWHISLSTWLRDYLYIPLGGNRVGTLMQYRNLILTMLLGGLWHGASYNFVLWGALHGFALAAHKLWQGWFPVAKDASGFGPRSLSGWLATQLFVFVTWIPFRAENFTDTQVMLSALTFMRDDHGLKTAELPSLLLVLPLIADHVFTYNPVLRERVSALVAALPVQRLQSLARTEIVVAVLGVCFAVALVYVQLKVQNFIYFQF